MISRYVAAMSAADALRVANYEEREGFAPRSALEAIARTPGDFAAWHVGVEPAPPASEPSRRVSWRTVAGVVPLGLMLVLILVAEGLNNVSGKAFDRLSEWMEPTP